jgi:hypothetical protein
MKKVSGRNLCLGVLCMLCTGVASASTINIGTGTGGATYDITVDTITEAPDSGYTGTAIDITSLPGSPFTHIGTVTDGTDPSSQWVGPAAAQATETSSVSGNVTYTVQFNLTGFTLSTASLILDVAADDFVNSITLNSTPIFAPTSGEKSAGMWTSGVSVGPVTSGFITGLNTLTFVVDNSASDGTTSCCGPTGLIVSADVTATPSGVPEPATLGLVGFALVGLGLARRRFSR